MGTVQYLGWGHRSTPDPVTAKMAFFSPAKSIPGNRILVRWTLDFGMDSQQVFGGFGSKDFRLRCFVVKLIWPSWNCGKFDGMYVEIGYAWISMVTEEVKGSKYFKILEYPPDFG